MTHALFFVLSSTIQKRRKLETNEINGTLAALTDEVERFLEVLLEVLMAGVRGGYLPVRDTPLLVVAGQLRGDVQHPGGAEGAQ